MFFDFLQQSPPLVKQTSEETSPSANVGWPLYFKTKSIFYSFAALTHEKTSWTFQIKAHPSIILYLLNEYKIAEFVIQPQYKIL